MRCPYRNLLVHRASHAPEQHTVRVGLLTAYPTTTRLTVSLQKDIGNSPA